jgi:hypothetical protein
MKASLCFACVLLACGVGGAAAEHCSSEPSDYVLEITAEGSGPPIAFKGAIGQNGQVQLIEKSTPQRIELRTASFVAMFSTVSGSDSLRATLYGVKPDGSLEKIGHYAGRSGLILENAVCPEMPRSFGGL